MIPLQRAGWIALMIAAFACPASSQTIIAVPLATGDASKLTVGTFTSGTLLQISVSGSGDLVDSRFQTSPDGSLVTAAGSPYTFANQGQPYPSVSGFPSGDGVNHFSGGGANYDFTGSGWMFAGKQTTDTTDPAAIRAGALVGTFVSSPTRGDWFQIGYGGRFAVPTGGATLYVAVNDSYPFDNHGSYSLTFTAVPEPSTAALVAVGVLMTGAGWMRRRFVARR